MQYPEIDSNNFRQQSWHLGISQNVFGNRTDSRKRSLNAINISPFTHQVYPDQIEKNIDIEKGNETDSNQHLNSHRLNKRQVLNTTVDSKDSYVIVPTARKRTLHTNEDNRRISVVVHNITSLISDDIKSDSTAPSYRYKFFRSTNSINFHATESCHLEINRLEIRLKLFILCLWTENQSLRRQLLMI